MNLNIEKVFFFKFQETIEMDSEVLSNAILELKYFTKKLGELMKIFEQENARIQQKKRTSEQDKDSNKRIKIEETSGTQSDTGSVVFLEEIKVIHKTPQKTDETKEKNLGPKKSNDAKKLDYKIIKQKLKQSPKLQSPKK